MANLLPSTISGFEVLYSVSAYLIHLIYIWQTLIAGGFAIVAAWLTVDALRKQAREDAERKMRAARVMLPAALDALIDYAVDCVRWLNGIREKATNSEKGMYKDAIAVGACPRPAPGLIAALRDCVETADLKHVHFISKLVSKIQIQNAWARGLHDYLTNYSLYDVKRVGLDKEIDESIVKSILLVALANSLFRYARMETDEEPRPLDLAAIRIAFRACHLEEFKNVTVWNALTNPYLAAEPYVPSGSGGISEDEFEEIR